MQSQFDHLSETYFNNFEYDLGERELGYALALDHDLEMFAASVGLIKTSVAAVLKDDGMCDHLAHYVFLVESLQMSTSTSVPSIRRPTSLTHYRSSSTSAGAQRFSPS